MSAGPLSERLSRWRQLLPGIFAATLVAGAAQFVSDNYQAPTMLMALLFGIAMNFLSEESASAPGIQFASRTILRSGVALLGARISVDIFALLGVWTILLVVLGVGATILFATLIASSLRQGPRFAILTGGAVAVCGASAAMAIAACLPKDERSENNLIFTVLSVTLLSTVAMIVYPILIQYFDLSMIETGVFLGGTIHDVAQVVGAGFSVSEETGEIATLVKLLRVSMLAPIVLVISIYWRRKGGQHAEGTPILPQFVIWFLIFAAINSVGWMPEEVVEFTGTLSRWLLVIAIAAVGMKISLAQVMVVGWRAIAFVTLETIFIATLVLGGLKLIATF
ncbi:putative sulfate exporter family transporter [Martelella mediterranea]|uniref:YeiH family protein n=1 Tax=Martelella mediterranea TaxID=293089 RepID=UPI001E3B2E3D|nr:putative sulfate exporter family transporter [Martelella mediterranea]MCD1636459.1 putative sulfate exporter family transporter [Martelella mediterranea]